MTVWFVLTFVCGMAPGAAAALIIKALTDDRSVEQCEFVKDYDRCTLNDDHGGPHRVRGLWYPQ